MKKHHCEPVSNPRIPVCVPWWVTERGMGGGNAWNGGYEILYHIQLPLPAGHTLPVIVCGIKIALCFLHLSLSVCSRILTQCGR